MQQTYTEKLARIMQIQQSMHELDQELELLLGAKASKAETADEPLVPRRRSKGKLPDIVKLESRGKIKDVIREVSASAPRFSETAILMETHQRGIRTSRMQVNQIITWMRRGGLLVELPDRDGGQRWFSRIMPTPVETQTTFQNKPTVSFWGTKN